MGLRSNCFTKLFICDLQLQRLQENRGFCPAPGSVPTEAMISDWNDAETHNAKRENPQAAAGADDCGDHARDLRYGRLAGNRFCPAPRRPSSPPPSAAHP